MINDKDLSTEVTDEDIADGIEDKSGEIYSRDGSRLLKGSILLSYQIRIRIGTKVICENAFMGCCYLVSIYIPETITCIGKRAFYHCDSLASIQVNGKNKAFDSRDNCNAIIHTATNTLIVGCNNTIIPSSITHIGDSAFSGCRIRTTFDIPNSVTTLGNYAFLGCTGLTSVTIPNSIITIGRYAFSYCNSLTNITIPNSVTTICDSAFRECHGLTSVTIPDSVTNIGYAAFRDCI